MDWDAELTASSSLQRRRELRLGVPGNVPEADMQLFGRRADGQAEVLAQGCCNLPPPNNVLSPGGSYDQKPQRQ